MEIDGTPDKKAKTAFEIAMFRAQTGNILAGGDRESREQDDPDDPYADWDFVDVDNVSSCVDSEDVVSSAPNHVHEENVEDIEDLTEMPKLPQPDHENFEVCCHWKGPMFDYGGYAKMNRSYIIGLKNIGSLVKTEPMESVTNVNKKTEDFLRYLSEVKLPHNYPKVFGMTIPDALAHGGPKILYTMMETSNHVHQEYADRLNLADEIWTPCQWNVDVFRNTNVYPEIKLMPLGVDTNLYKPGAEPLQFSNGTKEFRFISVFGWSYRKGMDVLLQAYLQEFGPDDDVSLILSTRFVGTLEKSSHDRILNDFNHIKSLVKKTEADMPHVVLHSAYTPEHRMPRLYASAHCFVLPSRGEGFGMPYIESGACGLPVIASDHGGQKDFLDEEVAYMVPHFGYYTSRRTDTAFKNMAWISHFYEDQEFPQFTQESVEILQAKMRQVYENYSEAQEKAKKLRARIVERYDWSVCIHRVYERLAQICGGS